MQNPESPSSSGATGVDLPPGFDLAPWSELLPGWVSWASAALSLVYGSVGMLLVAWIARLAVRRLDRATHWTEQARFVYPAVVALSMGTVMLIALTTMMSFQCTGDLSWFGFRTLAVLTLVVLSLVSVWTFWRFHLPLHQDPQSLVDYLRDRLAIALIFRFSMYAALPLAIFLPGKLDPVSIAAIVLCSLLVLWLAAGGGFMIARTLGLVVPADDRLRGLVHQSGDAFGVRPSVWIIRSRMANAFALPLLGAVAFTERALRVLDDNEILAISHHEMSHIVEPRLVTLTRFTPTLLFIVGGCWNPIWEAGGAYLLLGLVGGISILSLLAQRVALRMEERADQDAREHSPQEAFARALERLYESNLVPAVLRGKRKTHPDLYDRLVAAGVTPSYERPAPPPRGPGPLIVLVVALWVIAYRVPMEVLSRGPLDQESQVLTLMALTGGSGYQMYRLSEVYAEADPERSLALLAWAQMFDPDWPGYPARFAQRLLTLGRLEQARHQLQRATELNVEGNLQIQWLQELLAEVTHDLQEAESQSAGDR